VRQSGCAAAQRDLERILEPDLDHVAVNLRARIPRRVEVEPVAAGPSLEPNHDHLPL
jgi:hypothetical protein